MKKFAAMLMTCLLVLCMMTGASAAKHTHTAGEVWNRDTEQHWLECECGEKMKAAAHVMDEDYWTMCTVCGSDIWVFGDMFVDIMNYNEYGEIVRSTTFDGEGNLLEDYFHVYEYDENGNKLHSATYRFDVLYEEVEYAPGVFGEYLAAKQTTWSDDGSKYVNEYDGYGNFVHSMYYDELGELCTEETVSYEYDEEGNILSSQENGYYVDGISYLRLIDRYGHATKEVYYNVDGVAETEFLTEYEYDEKGNILYSKGYTDGVLTSESVYMVIPDEWGDQNFEQLYTGYLPDGSKEIFEYNEHADAIRHVLYDAEGNVEYEYRYEYKYDENGNIMAARNFENERVVREELYHVIDTEEYYIHYLKTVIEYAEDGIKSVEEFNEDGDTVDYRRYDAEGKELEMMG